MRYWSKNTCLTGSALFLTIWEYITMLTDWKAKPIEPESKHLNLLWIPILTSISISVFVWDLNSFYLDFFAISSSFLSFSLSNIVHSLTFSHFRTIGFLAYLTLGMNFSDFFTFVKFFYCALYVWIQAKFSHTWNDFWNSANIKLRSFTVKYTKF